MITINQIKETTFIPVRIYFEGGYKVIGGMTLFAKRLYDNMSYAEKFRYDFYQGQLNRKGENHESY